MCIISPGSLGSRVGCETFLNLKFCVLCGYIVKNKILLVKHYFDWHFHKELHSYMTTKRPFTCQFTNCQMVKPRRALLKRHVLSRHADALQDLIIKSASTLEENNFYLDITCAVCSSPEKVDAFQGQTILCCSCQTFARKSHLIRRPCKRTNGTLPCPLTVNDRKCSECRRRRLLELGVHLKQPSFPRELYLEGFLPADNTNEKYVPLEVVFAH